MELETGVCIILATEKSAFRPPTIEEPVAGTDELDVRLENLENPQIKKKKKNS